MNTHERSSGTRLEQKNSRKRFVLVACLFIGICVAYLDRINVSVLGADDTFLMTMGIRNSPVRIGMMMSLFLVSYGISNILLAPLGDRFGPRRSMMLCIALWTVSLLMGGFAGTFTMILASRVVLGIGEGFYYPLQSLFVKNWFPKRERGRANATWTIGQSVAPALAMPFFAWLISSFGWRSNFHVCLALGLIPLYLLWRHTADTPRQHKTISEAELQYIESGQDGEAAVNGAAVPLKERLKMFTLDYRFWLLVVWYTCLQFMFWGLITWLPSYLKTARNFSWTEMGWLASLPFVLGIFSKALSGVIADKIGRSAPILMVSMLLAGVCVYAGAVTEHKYLSAVLLAMAVGSCTMGTPCAWTLLQGLVNGKCMATASGTMNGISSCLSSLSPALIGLFIDLTGQYSGGLMCLVFTGAVAALAAGVLVLKKR